MQNEKLVFLIEFLFIDAVPIGSTIMLLNYR